MSGNRAGRAAEEQLERAGFGPRHGAGAAQAAGVTGGAAVTGGAGGAVDASPAVTVVGLRLDTEVKTRRHVLDVAAVAQAAAAVAPLLLVRGRQGERRTVAERVALQPGAADAVEQPAT